MPRHPCRPRCPWGAGREVPDGQRERERVLEGFPVLPISGTNPVVVPGLQIAIAVLGFNLLGDGLRDRLDPRLAGRR